MNKFITFTTCIVLLSSACSSTSKDPQVFTVEIKDMKFIPEELTVHKGNTVVWINTDIVTHDVTEEETKTWTSSAIESGQSWKMEITSPFDYYCSIHVIMKGKILVD